MVERFRSGLFLDPGLGKTSITLLAIQVLKLLGRFDRALVIAPLRVVYQVWPGEVTLWEQFGDLRVSVVHGPLQKRLEALKQEADLYLINPEGVEWLYDLWSSDRTKIPKGLSTLIVDESTRFKTHAAICWRALKALLPIFRRRHILTGTPCANNLEALYTQIYILDEGKRLGKNITAFRSRWFYRGGYENREWLPFPGSKTEIEAAIADLVLRVDGGDFIDLPELLVNDVELSLPAPVLKAYKKLERELFFELDSIESTAFSASAKYNLCRQVANGGIYTDGELNGSAVRSSETIHSGKIDALDSIFEELSGKPLLVAYQFKHDLKRLLEWKKAPAISGGQTPKTTEGILSKWNRGESSLLFAQCQTISHGLNMQAGGSDLAWFGLPDDLEIYLQTNKRLHRSGSTAKQVRIHRLIARSTVDVLIRKRLDAKDAAQTSFLDSLRSSARAYLADQE